ncbi:DUF3262 family protein [Caviibacterium pharyngocola]|uniref:TIGR03758 family integrating conjugative element protein n=1 Tax=Caviibacterium pharyngocola TaxID=28159 RepID=A0A2M8RV67_9PAST|nr:DUF3262 family protein [Caviibacterium pharyngocola]PJG82777.1 hypothetical protein CVP04_07380 [Caviibacterium pharyngocola]
MSGTSPIEVFETASGMNPTSLKIVLTVIFVAGVLLAYAWAVNSGFKGFTLGNGTIWSFLILVLKGLALLICLILFFIY